MTEFSSTHPRAAVHSIDHFALNVPSIDEAHRFFEAFGLTVNRAGRQGDELEIRATDGHRWGRVLAGARKEMAYLGFNCYEDDLADLRAQTVAAGASAVASMAEGGGAGFEFRDPDGNLIQVRVGPKTSPNSKTASPAVVVPADARGACTRAEVVRVKPRRLSHVLLFSPDVLRAVSFYERALGLRLSDKSLDLIAFTHAPHGCDHHLVAFAKSRARGWHHSSWDVEGVDLVGEGAAQMLAAGYAKGWGTGRHVLGSNYFHYVEDPWGSFCEYSADIDFVSAGRDWPAGDFAPEDSLYLWGPNVPENFIHNTEAQD